MKDFYIQQLTQYYTKLKKGVITNKKEFLFFLIVILFFLYVKFYIWSFGLVIYGIVFFSSKTSSKPISFAQNLVIIYKQNVLNRKYLRIKHFWKHNFKNAFKNLKFSQLIWQLPLILSISFYNAISTRYMFITTIFYARCSIIIFVLENPKGWFIILAYFLPLVFITQLCGMRFISDSLNKTYGKTTMKKLGFNMLNAFLYGHGAKMGGQ